MGEKYCWLYNANRANMICILYDDPMRQIYQHANFGLHLEWVAAHYFSYGTRLLSPDGRVSCSRYCKQGARPVDARRPRTNLQARESNTRTVASRKAPSPLLPVSASHGARRSGPTWQPRSREQEQVTAHSDDSSGGRRGASGHVNAAGSQHPLPL